MLLTLCYCPKLLLKETWIGEVVPVRNSSQREMLEFPWLPITKEKETFCHFHRMIELDRPLTQMGLCKGKIFEKCFRELEKCFQVLFPYPSACKPRCFIIRSPTVQAAVGGEIITLILLETSKKNENSLFIGNNIVI